MNRLLIITDFDMKRHDSEPHKIRSKAQMLSNENVQTEWRKEEEEKSKTRREKRTAK